VSEKLLRSDARGPLDRGLNSLGVTLVSLVVLAGCQSATEPTQSADQSTVAAVLSDDADPRTLTLPPIDGGGLGDLELPPSPTPAPAPSPDLPSATSNRPVSLTDCLAHNPFAVPSGLLPSPPPGEVPVFAEVERETSSNVEELLANEAAITIEQFFSEALHEQFFGDQPAKRLSESAAPPPSRPLLADTELFRRRELPPLVGPFEEPRLAPTAPPIVRVFALNYLSRADVEPVLANLLTPSGKTRFATTEARDAAPPKTEVLVVDEPHAVHRVENYLAQTDRPPPHVLIEAHVLQVGLAGGTWQGVNLLSVAADLGGQPAAETAQHYVHFPAGQTLQVLHALQSTFGAQPLASPELLVLSGRGASSQVGANATIAGAGIPFDRGVLLQVTPTVTGDGRVWLRIHPEIADGQVNLATGSNAQAAIDTTVLLADGEAFVIGGLIHQRDVEVWTKRRILGDLPVIGSRFQQRYLVPTRTEILIVLSPRIVPATIGQTASD